MASADGDQDRRQSRRVRVQSGDTLLAIARKYNTTVQAIADTNKMTSNATLRVGQQILIPKS